MITKLQITGKLHYHRKCDFQLSKRKLGYITLLPLTAPIEIIKCLAVSKVTTRVKMLSFGNDTALQSFCHSFIALSMILCSKSAEKSAVQMCHVANIVIETTRVHGSKPTFYRSQ